MSRAGYLSERQYSRRKLGLLSVRGEVTQSARWVSSLEGVADGGNGRWHLASPWREPRSGRWPIRTNASPLDHTACEEGLVTLPHLPLRFVVKGPQVDVGQGARHRLRPRGACCPHHGRAPAVGCLWTGSRWSEQRVLLCLPHSVPHTSLWGLSYLLFPLRGFALSHYSYPHPV